MIEIPRVQPVSTPANKSLDDASKHIQESSRESAIPTEPEQAALERRRRHERRSKRKPRPGSFETRHLKDRRNDHGISVDV